MGALAPISPWIPEDDILLKNAVEFGDFELFVLSLCPVLRYQNENTKRAIIRLEQVVQSYMQRAMAFRGAFAIFYGRHFKNYIKKSETLLGRATNDVDVDIDLRREGRANKISRRQAMIKMDEDGSFYLKNLGKCPILVNSKEVATGQRLSLKSCCLIEIQGMRFMFEKFQYSSR